MNPKLFFFKLCVIRAVKLYDIAIGDMYKGGSNPSSVQHSAAFDNLSAECAFGDSQRLPATQFYPVSTGDGW